MRSVCSVMRRSVGTVLILHRSRPSQNLAIRVTVDQEPPSPPLLPPWAFCRQPKASKFRSRAFLRRQPPPYPGFRDRACPSRRPRPAPEVGAHRRAHPRWRVDRQDRPREAHRPRRQARARPAPSSRHPPPARPRGAASHPPRPAERDALGSLGSPALCVRLRAADPNRRGPRTTAEVHRRGSPQAGSASTAVTRRGPRI
jgi:hypothetical protein